MRKAFLTIILIILLAAAASTTISAQQMAKRTIVVNQYGLVYVYDEVPSTGEQTILKFPKALVKNLVNYVSPNDPNPELRVENDTFSIVIKSTPGEIVKLTTIFRDQLLWNSRDQLFQLRMPLYPVVPGAGEKAFYVEIVLPVDAEISSITPEYLNETGRGLLSATLESVDLSGGKFEELTLTFSSTMLKVLDISSARMIVDPFDRKIDLALKVKSLAGRAGSKLYLKLPSGSRILETRDSVGAISKSYDAETGELTLNLRQPLSAGYSAYVEVSFELPKENSIIEVDDGRLKVEPLLPMNTTAWLYEVDVVLRGASPKSWNPEPYELYRKYPETTVLSYKFSHVDPINVNDMKVNVEFERSFSIFSILPYVTGAAILIFIAGAVTAIYAKKPIEALEAEEKPLGLLLNEGQSLISAYQAIADLIASGKIYEKSAARKILLEARADTRRSIERIRKLGREIEKAKPEASEDVKRIERAVQVFEKTVEKAWNLAYPYFSGSLSKKKLGERLEEYREELKKAYSQLVDSLETLRRRLG